jgi:hypothetical protein
MRSIFRVQPPNLKEFSGAINGDWGVFKIDYAPHQNRWFSRRTASHDGGRTLVILNVHDPQNMTSYEWYRSDLQAIVESEDTSAIERLLKEDVLNYLL